MTVSVVLPVYNGEKYLAQTVRSALDQSLPPLEVILVDDGSKDRTPKIIESLKSDPRVRSTRVEPNAGVANAMTVGMGMATGKYIAFLDHDDFWFKDKLKKQTEAMEAHPDAVLCICNFIQRPITAKNRKRVRHFSKLSFAKSFDPKYPLLDEPFLNMVKENVAGTSSSVMVKNSLCKTLGGFNTKYRITGDFDYWLRCSAFGPFVIVPEVLMYKRTHDHNISSNLIRMWMEHRQILREFPAFLKKKGIHVSHWEERCREEAAEMGYFMGNYCFGQGDKAAAFDYYKEALRENPTLSNRLRYLATISKRTISAKVKAS